MIKISPTIARRLAVTRQRLAGDRPSPDRSGIMDLLTDIRCLQIDPIRAVERTQYLVLWSRLGAYDPEELHALLWGERRLFEYLAHAASIVRTEDYPFFGRQMADWGAGNSAWEQRSRRWAKENQALRDHVLEQLAENGPLASDQFEDRSERAWTSSGWTNGRTVNRMLDHLWFRGRIAVAGRQGLKRLWDLTERHLPDWTPDPASDWSAVVYQTAQIALRALGVARRRHIREHFMRGAYPDLEDALKRLVTEELILPVTIQENGAAWPGRWFIHAADLPLMESLRNGQWRPRTTLLSPFDNLICDRKRAQELFDFYFRIEIYVPRDKRQFGYYVLPILHGDRLIGRIDPKMDRKSERLNVNAVFAEPDAPQSAATGRAIRRAIEDLAGFLGAREIEFGETIPDGWRPGLLKE